MAHLHEVRDQDTHYIINPIENMAITNANEAKNKLQLGDHNSEIYTFEIPKVVEGHDMTLCNMVEVHYINVAADKANKSEGVFKVKDMGTAEDLADMLVFTWEVSCDATMYAGSLNFRIKFACTDENGNYTYKKWTSIYKGITIDDGFDNGEAVAEEYTDILAQWETRLDSLEENAIKLQNELRENTAIKKSFYGSSIDVTDRDYRLPLKVEITINKHTDGSGTTSLTNPKIYDELPQDIMLSFADSFDSDFAMIGTFLECNITMIPNVIAAKLYLADGYYTITEMSKKLDTSKLTYDSANGYFVTSATEQELNGYNNAYSSIACSHLPKKTSKITSYYINPQKTHDIHICVDSTLSEAEQLQILNNQDIWLYYKTNATQYPIYPIDFDSFADITSYYTGAITNMDKWNIKYYVEYWQSAISTVYSLFGTISTLENRVAELENMLYNQ